MTFTWLGPFKILDILSNSTCLLRNIKGNYKRNTLYIIFKPFVEKKSNSKICEVSLECGNLDEFQRQLNLMKHPSKDIRQKIAEKQGLNICYVNLIDRKENDVPLKMHVCKADRKCFFLAILFLLTGSECQHVCVCELVVKHMMTKPCSGLLSVYFGDDVEMCHTIL